jgi:subtilase family serine protease
VRGGALIFALLFARPSYRSIQRAIAMFRRNTGGSIAGGAHLAAGSWPESAAIKRVAPSSGRLHSNIDDSKTFVLMGNTRPVVMQGLAQDQGKEPGSRAMPRMAIHFTMTAAQRADLEQLLTDQQNRRSPQYRKFLAPEEYAACFGLNEGDLGKITLWLENGGFSNLQVARSRTWVSFSGTVAHAEAAFHTHIHKYSFNGEAHFANATDPQLPKALEGIVENVRGLHNFRMKPHVKRPQPRFTGGVTPYYYHFLAPDDWQTIYNVKPLYNTGFDGSSVTIAVVGQSDVLLSDIEAFRSAASLPVNNPIVVTPPGYTRPEIVNGDETESDLDLEWSGAIAKNANILFITTSATADNGVEDSIIYAIDSNVAPILSTSYGLCEADISATDLSTLTNLFAQASAQGMTIVAASGDNGGAACDTATTQKATHGLAVDFPASSPHVTGVGGTEFSEGNGNYWSTTKTATMGRPYCTFRKRYGTVGSNLHQAAAPAVCLRNRVGKPGRAYRMTASAMFPTLHSRPRLCVTVRHLRRRFVYQRVP